MAGRGPFDTIACRAERGGRCLPVRSDRNPAREALLVVTVSKVADRRECEADGPIVPDENVGAVEAEAAALHWLTQRCESA